MTFKKALLASTAAAVLLGAALPAGAAGTAANSPVTNAVDLSYDSGTTPISTPNAASDTFVVDEKVNFTLVAQDGTTVTVNPAESTAQLTFLLTNTGNEDRNFDVTVTQSDNGDPISLTYDPTNSGAAGTWSFYTSPVSGTGSDTAHVVTGTNGIGTIPADGNVYLKIIAHIPDNADQDQEDVFDVTVVPVDATGTAPLAADTAFGDGSSEIVFGDLGLDGTETAQETFFVSAAMITGTKEVFVVSENRDGSFSCAASPTPAGAPFDAFIPGACVEYVITLENDSDAGQSATNFSFTDTLPAGVTFMGTIDNVGFDSVVINAGAGIVTGTVNSLAPGDSASIAIRAQID